MNTEQSSAEQDDPHGMAELRAQVTAELAAGRRLLARFGPAYGTPEWEALPDADPVKVRAVVDAAEAWRWHCSTEEVTRALRAELDAIDHEATGRLVELAADVADAGAGRWHRIATGPSAAEMRQRRYPWLFDPNYPPGHPGGPVPWRPASTRAGEAA